MITLRPYQQQGIDAIRAEMRKGHKRIVYQAPTGSGKTVQFSYIVKSATSHGNHCMIVSNRVELLEQTGGTFENIGLRYENVTAGSGTVPHSQVSIAMVETLKRRLKTRLDFQMYVRSLNIIIIDECFIEGTKIDNTNIEDIKPGDSINSFNHINNIIERKQVKAISKKRINELLVLIKYLDDFIVCTQ